MSTAAQFLPALRWLLGYPKAQLRGDLRAGVTTAVLLVPQSMAYASLAGLPPVLGLYASLAPILVYAVLGTSRQLAVGPTALSALLVARGIGAMELGSAEAVVASAVGLAALVGVFQLLFGLLRLGGLAALLTAPVLHGFTSAAALLIAFSQLETLLGITRGHALTFAVGASSVVLLLALRRWGGGLPGPLLVMLLGIVLTAAFDGAQYGLAVVGSVPAGLPAVAVPRLDFAMAGDLAGPALAIAVVGYAEAIAVAKAMATRDRGPLEPNQELIALGAANVAGSLTGALPVSGGLSRSAVNARAGARSPLAGLITAGTVGLILLVAMPLFHALPRAVLAAVIVTAVAGLLNLRATRALYHAPRWDFGIAVLTFAATLGLGIETGLLLGAGAAWITGRWRRCSRRSPCPLG